jgi:hypothetical protein
MQPRERISWVRALAAEYRAKETPCTGTAVPIGNLIAGFLDGMADKLETSADRQEGYPERPKIRRRQSKSRGME